MMLKTMGLAVLVAVAMSAGCRKPAPEAEAPAATAQTQPYQVAIVSAGPMKTSAAPVEVTVMDAGKPVNDVDVSIEMRMPPTASMGEMRTGADLKGAGDGHYRGQLDLACPARGRRSCASSAPGRSSRRIPSRSTASSNMDPR